MKKPFLLCGLTFLLCTLVLTGKLHGQNNETERDEALSSLSTDEKESPSGENQELPRIFRNFSLEMGLDDLKNALIKDTYFNYRGDRDVSLLPYRDETLIDISGYSFIKRAYFQLKDKTVYIMAFSLNPELIDHYSVYTTFTKKYGEPAVLDPKQAVWTSETTRISIERPLTIKYIDLGTFNEIIDESKLRGDVEIKLRQEFLDDF